MKKGSTRRPVEGATSQKMDVEVWNGLPGSTAVVDRNSKPRTTIKFFSHMFGSQKEVPKESCVAGLGCTDARNRLFRNDQQVDGRLRTDVVKYDAVLILMLDVSGYFTLHYLLK